MARPGDDSRTDALIECTDALPCYALPEMKAVGLQGYFDPTIILQACS